MVRVTAVVAFLSCLVSPTSGQTIVQGGGDAIWRALQNANHGDVLLVRAGDYRGFRTGLGVTIVCQTGVTIWEIVGAAVWVDRLPAGRTFAMIGGVTTPRDLALNVIVQDCRGTVAFDGVSTTAGRESHVRDSDAVSFHRCVVLAPSAVRSTVVFADSVCAPVGLFEGVRAERSEVFVAGGDVRGADSTSAAFPPRPGIALIESSLVVAGDGSTTVAAGAGAGSPPAIAGDARSRVVVGPRVRILSAASVPIVAGSVAVRETPAVSLSGLPRLSPQRVDTMTEPGALVATFVDTVRGPVRGPFGAVWVTAAAIVADVGTAPASGVRSFVVHANVSVGSTFTVQSATLLGSGAIVFGAPAIVVSY